LKRHTTSQLELEQLAQRINVKTDWKQLRLPQEQVSLLHQIAEHARQRNRMLENYGLPDKIKRGVGISALFTGTSGTGKTLAAQVIANDQKLDLYRVDLSNVVSKYIGETEKNLGRIFDVAGDSNAVLLFDEADSLFGKRSEVKDAHDRYANISNDYLLQRIESYQGIVILTTNSKESIDHAFIRRLRFIVDFPAPLREQRNSNWNKPIK
jgi:SpoVK/Ycf46/Vps4 family AAA+-type ATPase